MSSLREWFDIDLNELNKEILKMGGIIEEQIYEAVQSLSQYFLIN